MLPLPQSPIKSAMLRNLPPPVPESVVPEKMPTPLPRGNAEEYRRAKADPKKHEKRGIEIRTPPPASSCDPRSERPR